MPLMPNFSKAFLSFACLVFMTGCDRSSLHAAVTNDAAQDAVTEDVNRMEAEVRIAAANKRIDELERQVGELQSNPEKLDLEVLTSRVAALEASQSGVAADREVLLPKAMPVSPAVPASPSRANGGRQTTPKQSSSLHLPELEPRSRLATPDESKSFARGK
jgi:uncharacterized coiled-coil protein SlyX